MSVCVVGSLNVDWVLQVPALPRVGETLLASGLTRHVGGKGANQAVAAARAGSTTRLIGRIGADEAGSWLVAFLASQQIDVSGVRRDPDAPTGQAFITTSLGGDNSIVVVPGANARLPAPIDSSQHCGDAVVLAQLETSVEAVAAWLAAAGPRGLKILNAAPALPAARALFEQCDVLVFNETELASYAGAALDCAQTHAVVTAAKSLLERAEQSIVVTRGARGVVIVRSDVVHEIAGRAVRVVDAVGAGDCFCGVLAAGLDQGLALAAAARRANLAAAIAVGRQGAAAAMPTSADIESEDNDNPL